MERNKPTAPQAIGTAVSGLVEPCSVEPGQRVISARPAPPPREPAVALAFSGGGFRATLAALGVVRFVADAGLLGQVRWISSVSGGSIANGLVACSWSKLAQADFAPDAVDEITIEPFVERISTRSLTLKLFRNIWRTIGPGTRTHVLARSLDDWFFHGQRLDQLPPGVRFVFNASNLTTGVRFGFERDVLGDYVVGLARTAGTGLRVADAVACSAAVPGAFAPYEIRGVTFPCADGLPTRLLDGGAYDNMGMEVLDGLRTPSAPDRSLFEEAPPQRHEDPFLVALNAGGIFRTRGYGRIPFVRHLARAQSLLYRQSTALRMRAMVERFQAYERAAPPAPDFARRGVLFGLATTLPAVSPAWSAGRDPQESWRIPLAFHKTTFMRVPRETCHRLIYRAWWLTGASIATYHPGLIPASALPRWRDLS